MPILFSIGNFIIPSWHFMFLMGAFVAYCGLLKLGECFYPEISKDSLMYVYIVCYIGGYLGARALSIFIDEAGILSLGDFFSRLLQLGPMTFYGGFIGALIFGLFFVKAYKLNFWKLFDIGIIAGFMALVLGRIGCFLNGDDYGVTIYELGYNNSPWWAVDLYNHMKTTPRVPIQLIESLGVCFFIFWVVFFFQSIKRALGAGGVGGISVCFYSVFRFWNELYRGDERGWFIRNVLSPSQFISCCLFIICIVFLLFRYNKYRSIVRD